MFARRRRERREPDDVTSRPDVTHGRPVGFVHPKPSAIVGCQSRGREIQVSSRTDSPGREQHDFGHEVLAGGKLQQPLRGGPFTISTFSTASPQRKITSLRRI